MRRGICFAAALAAAALATACDKGTPVAPAGSLLAISASPSQVPLGGSSLLTITALRSNGVPVNPGTEIFLTTTLGTVPHIVTTDDRGIARALLEGGTRSGTATVTASSGTAAAATVDVTIGLPAGGVSLQATPQTLGEAGGTVSLTAVVRDDQGDPLANASAVFDTDLGTLASRGAVLRTDDSGRVRDTLTVTASEIAAFNGDQFDVSVSVVAGGATITATDDVLIVRRPEASFTFQRNGLQVTFTDTSTGNPTSWLWDFGDGGVSTLQNPAHSYAAEGTYLVTLTVTNPQGSDSTQQFVTVVRN